MDAPHPWLPSERRGMKTNLILICGWLSAAVFFHVQAAEPGVKGGSASATGGSATGGSVTGGSVTGGSATGGSATGGTATARSVTSGTSTPGTVTPGTVTAIAAGREIRVTARGSVSVHSNGGQARVSIGPKTLIVGRTKLMLDGEKLGEISSDAKRIDMVEDQGMLSVKADGKELAKVKLGEP